MEITNAERETKKLRHATLKFADTDKYNKLLAQLVVSAMIWNRYVI